MIDGLISRRLSRKLLLMTIAFVMLAEILIFIPSAAMFRQNWLEDRAIQSGHLTLALTGVPNYEGSEMLSKQFMADTDVIMLSTKREGMTELVLGSPPEDAVFEIVDLRSQGRFPQLGQAFSAFVGADQGYLRVLSNPVVEGQDWLEYIVPKVSLRSAMRDYFQRIFLLSLLIAVITGVLLYLTLSALIVRPIQSLATGISDFKQDPETRRSLLGPSNRKDEIGQLQREFYDMKQGLRASLEQKERLAALGLAVAKINHDLRNVLTSAHLVSDRLAMDKEERVALMGQRLVRAIDRGVQLCADVLNFSQAKEDIPDMEPVRISFLAGEAAGDVIGNFGSGKRAISFKNNIPSEYILQVDPDHTYRIFHNLLRNAAQALANIKDDDAKREISLSLEEENEHIFIHVADTGPGLPKRARENLFKAFVSASGHGSSGLGLTISKELAKAQGGDLVLTQSDGSGTIFAIRFPVRN
jgi:signal transduction histidine kinase